MVALAQRVGGVAAANVVVQHLERERDDDRAAVAVHDGLGQAGGATGVDDPQRVVKRQPERLKLRNFRVKSGCSPCQVWIVCYRFSSICQASPVHQHMLNRGQCRQELGHHGAAVQRTTAVTDAVTGDQHPRLDLLETVQHGLGAHVGGADAPDTADADGGQKSHHGLGNIGQVGGHPVTGLHPLRAQVQGQRRHLLLQLRPRQFTGVALTQTVLVVADDGGQAGSSGRRHMAHHLSRIVHLGAGEPTGVGHGHTITHLGVGRG